MKKLITTTTASLAMCLMTQAAINIIPLPNKVEEIKDNQYEITAETAIRYDERLKKEATMLADAIEKSTGFKPKLYGERLRIHLASQVYIDVLETSDSKESYTLNVDKNGVKITGSDAAGAFYGTQSLLQLIPLEGKKILPGCKIEDAPRFGWRGMHLDVGRHMFDPKDIKKFIDQLAVHKLNTFHWHLTEDQGWRIEIKKYPKLTEIGAWRASTPPYGNRGGSDGKKYGGFYTQEQIKDIVAYAQDRHITIVPEIDMPGHMAAAIAAYPHLGNDDIPNYKPEVKCHWGVHPYILAPKEETFKFVDDILGELCELFPSAYIHIGGDEAPKGQWKQSKFAQSVMKREGCKNEHDLQSYFIGRLEKMLDKRGRKLIGWDEIREGGLSPKATMMLWRGWDHAIASVKEGHDVVMAPGSHTYFDHYQNNPAAELSKGAEFECIGGHRTLESAYSFDPMPKEFAGTAQAKHILGCQAQLWTEYMKTWDKVEYCAFPRVAALAESAWTQTENKNYENFYERIKPMIKRYQKAGINCFDPENAAELKAKDGAKVTTNLDVHGANLPVLIYDGSDKNHFWSSRGPKADDHLTIELKEAIDKGEISVTTGAVKKGNKTDTLENGVLEVSSNGTDWKKVADFKDGDAAGKATAGTKFIRIKATAAQGSWLIVNEVIIK